MASLATTLKQTATRLRDTLREDNASVDKIAELVESNTEGTKTQRTRLAQYAPPWWRDTVRYAATCVLALVLFFVMTSFIGHTTRKVPRFRRGSSVTQLVEVAQHAVYEPPAEQARVPPAPACAQDKDTQHGLLGEQEVAHLARPQAQQDEEDGERGD